MFNFKFLRRLAFPATPVSASVLVAACVSGPEVRRSFVMPTLEERTVIESTPAPMHGPGRGSDGWYGASWRGSSANR